MADSTAEIENNAEPSTSYLSRNKDDFLSEEGILCENENLDDEHVHDSEENVFDEDRLSDRGNEEAESGDLKICIIEESYDEKRYSVECELKQKSESGGATLDCNYLLHIMKILENQLNIKYEVKYDSNNVCYGIYFQDNQMEEFFNFYPEFVCIDMLCEIVVLELNLCLFISEDSNAHCEIVAACLIRVDDAESFSWMCEVFRKCNRRWENMRVIVSDRQGVEWGTIQQSFPVALVFISFFHSLKALKKDLSSVDLGVTSYDINEAIQIFEGMIFASSESDYTELLEKMQLLPVPLFEFFQKNWEPIREIWALGLKFESKAYLSSINNFLLLIRKKVRPVVNVQSTIESVIKGVFTSVGQLRKERFLRVTPVLQTLQIPSNNKSYFYRKYIKFLTYYASDLVVQQLNFAAGIKNIEKISNGVYKINTSFITVSSCSCIFYSLMSLPCCHIFVLRKFLSLPLFAEILCAARWTSNYYQSSYLVLHDIYVSETEKDQPQNVKNEMKQQFDKYFEVCGQLLPLLLDCPHDVSQQRITMFQNLLKAWKNDFEVDVNAIESKSLFPSTSTNHMALEDLSTDHWKEIYGISLKDILDSDNDFSSVSLCSEPSSDEI